MKRADELLAQARARREADRDYYWSQLTRFAKYELAGAAGTPEFYAGGL